MVYYINGETDTIVFTLTEKQTIQNPNYWFVLTERALNSEITFLKLNADNISAHKDRYDEISFVGDDESFADAVDGDYTYAIYEQDPITEVNGQLLESGILRYNNINQVAYTTHESNNTFITR